MRSLGSAIAHCPLSNAYFSHQPFPLREALDANVKVGLGSDVAGGYQIDMMTAMRQAVITSRTREGSRVETSIARGDASTSGASLAVHWTDTLFLATRGGAEALGLRGGHFVAGASFDAQLSTLAKIAA
ncbi:Metallo-dependent hydrolase [Clavulina sp. PMI_390]|nr:Metallo-dependent hydrolase [Clavulina sp. PMI_390]